MRPGWTRFTSLFALALSCFFSTRALADGTLRPLASFTFLQVDDPPPREPPPDTTSPALKDLNAKAAQNKAQQDADEAPAYKKWWFWALSAVVVGGTIALGAWAAEPSTQPARGCDLGVLACFGDGRPK
jgi:hypothetical protein